MIKIRQKLSRKNFSAPSEKNIKILSLEGYDGLFVEKGNFDQVKGVAAIKVRNDSNRMLEYAKLSFRVNEYERAEFDVKALPAHETCLAMEITAKPFNKDDKYALIRNSESSFETYCDADMNTDKISITSKGADVTVKNLSDKDISCATIYYKYYIDGMYYGGIAFSGKFQNIKKGESLTQTSERFAKNGKIVNTGVVY